MKKDIGLIIGVIVVVALFVGVYYLYGSLSKNHAPDRLADYGSQVEDYNESDTADSGSENTFVKAPDFTVYDIDGNEVKLSDFSGKPVVINFWATWCGYCTMEMPDFNDAFKEYTDVQFLMINATDGTSETVETASKYVEEQGFEFPVFYDTAYDAITNYGVNGFPASYFVDKNGNIITHASGMIGKDELKQAIEMIR